MLQRVPRPAADSRPVSPAGGEGKAEGAPPRRPDPLPAPRGEGERIASPGASRGLAAPEVTAAAAIAAGLPWEGPLAKESALRLYYLAVAAQAAGRLTLSGEKGVYALTFRKGIPEHARSTHPEDDLGVFLVQRGVLRPEQAADAEAAKGAFGGDLVGAVVGLKLVNPADAFRALQEYGVAVVWRALTAESRTGSWEPGAPPPPSSFALGVPWALLCDAVRRIDAVRARLRLGSRLGRSAVRVGGRIALEELRLTPQETRICGLFDGVRSIEEIAASRPNEVEVVVRLGLLLTETELLSFGAERKLGPAAGAPSAGIATVPPAAAPPAASVPPTAAKPADAEQEPTSTAGHPISTAGPPVTPVSGAKPPAPNPSSAARHPLSAAPRPDPLPAKRGEGEPGAAPASDLPALRATYARLEKADHFEVLGVKREASPAQIKAAYFQLARTYHPDAAPRGDPPEARKLRADIFAKVSEAWGVLGEDENRTRYLEQLESGGVGEVDVAAILKAEQLFEMATVLVRSRKYEEAAKKLDEAMELNASEPEFDVWKAWVAFLLAHDKKAQQASSASAIEAALRTNPRCMPGYLFLGQMAKLVGDAAAAEKHFKRGLALDTANVELQRELKYLKK